LKCRVSDLFKRTPSTSVLALEAILTVDLPSYAPGQPRQPQRALKSQAPTTLCKHGGLDPLTSFYERADKQAKPTVTSPQIRDERL